MNASELAGMMLEWETLQRQADALAEQIRQAVLEIGKTQTVGCVRASYSSGRKTYDYEGTVRNWFPAEVLDPMLPEYTTTKTTVDWKRMVDDHAISLVMIAAESGPTVTIKLDK